MEKTQQDGERQRHTIECPSCGYRHCPVTNTEDRSISLFGQTKARTRRRHKCRHCGRAFVTWEVYLSDIGRAESTIKQLQDSKPIDPRIREISDEDWDKYWEDPDPI